MNGKIPTGLDVSEMFCSQRLLDESSNPLYHELVQKLRVGRAGPAISAVMVEVAAVFEVHPYLLSSHGRNCPCNRECQDRSIHVNSFAFQGKPANVEYQLTIPSIGPGTGWRNLEGCAGEGCIGEPTNSDGVRVTVNPAEAVPQNWQEKMYP
jgi:hypothetical protein